MVTSSLTKPPGRGAARRFAWPRAIQHFSTRGTRDDASAARVGLKIGFSVAVALPAFHTLP